QCVGSTRGSSPRSHREPPAFPHANGFNGLFRTLPGDRAFLSPSFCGYGFVRARSGRLASAKLDAGVEASGPHDFAVRVSAVRPRACGRSRVTPPCDHVRAPDAAASTASHPASVTIAIRPSWGRDGAGYSFDLGQAETEIFLQMGLDEALV